MTADRLSVTWRGRAFEVRRTPAGDAGEPGEVWQVLRNGVLVTSFPAEAADEPTEVKDKVTGWLERDRARPVVDAGRR